VILQNGTNMPLAPQAFGEISPQFYPSYFVPRLGMSLETAFTTYGQLYRTQPWVYTAVNKVASSIARLGVNVWDESPSSGQELDLEGPFAKLMAEPCPTLDPYSFWAWTASTIEIYGETYWIKLRQGRGNQVSGFLPMHPSLVQIFRDQDGTEIYRFMGQPNQELDSSSVVKFRAFHPENYMRGMSRLEPLRLTLLNEDSSRRAMASWWKNGARPSMVLSSERELGTAGRERLKMAFQSEHQGTGNIGRTIVLEDGVTAAPMQYNADEMAYIVQAGIMKPSEARQYFDLNVAGAEADQLYANQALQPLGTPPGGETAGQPALEMGTHVPAIEGPGGNTVPSPAAQKHIRDMTAWLGRGLTLQAAAREVVNKTGDTEGVREACEFLLERRI
jgi:HK97 family phage portal protein